MRFADIFEAQVFLHEILIEAGHSHGDEYTADKLLSEMKLVTQEIIKEEYFGITAVFDSLGSIENAIIKTVADEINGQEHR